MDQLRAPGGDRWTEPQGDTELFPEGELLLQVWCCGLVIWGLPELLWSLWSEKRPCLAQSSFAVIPAGTEFLGTETSDTAWLGWVQIPIPTISSHPHCSVLPL